MDLSPLKNIPSSLRIISPMTTPQNMMNTSKITTITWMQIQISKLQWKNMKHCSMMETNMEEIILRAMKNHLLEMKDTKNGQQKIYDKPDDSYLT